MGYRKEFDSSINEPIAFWQRQAQQLAWYKQPQTILQSADAGNAEGDGIARWFVDGELNTSYLALDYHIEQGRGAQMALIYDSPVTNTIKQFTYIELRDAVAQCAGMLQQLGVVKGDRILIYLPMIPEAAIAMLACARIGAIHSVVFGGFAAHELAVRIDDATPKIILTASCGIEVDKVIVYKPILDSAIEHAQHKPQHCIVYQRSQCKAEMQTPRDLDWQKTFSTAPRIEPMPLRATDPLYVLYTSGTTGKPKGIVRDNGGHAVALHYSMRAIYDMKPGEVFWAASDVGWVVGHSYIVYAPLLAGCTSIFYEGKPVRTPDAGAFWRVVEQHKVKTLFAAPTAFRAIRKEDPEAALAKKYDLTSLKNLFLAGERLDPPTYEWLREKFDLPVIDHWWQTETGWAMAANPIGIESFPTKAGSATKPVPGFDVRILNDNGEECAPNEQGNIVVKLPLPPSCLPTVWNNHARFVAGYLQRFPGYYLCGDGGYFDEDGYVFVMGRIDDVINVAGHRLSTGEIEEVVAAHTAVAECAVIGIEDDMRGQVPIALAVIKDGSAIDENALENHVVAMVREQVGALANFKRLIVVKRLPKTRSGKILRAVLRAMCDGKEFTVPSTIDDPSSLEEIRENFRRRKIGVFAK